MLAKNISGKLLLLTTAFLMSVPAVAEEELDYEKLSNMTLEEIMNTQVYSASKRPEKLSDTAASVYVLTSQDIAKSGVTSIPEALRLVPGVNVAQSNNNTWAISIRGFNQQFSNKLLVLIDGRSVYTPLFSGVWWDTIDYVLDDIDRIEVVKGPGGTLWGANAVNGVINIITKEARKTQKNYASFTAGYNGQAIAEYRYGGKTGPEGTDNYYRVYGKMQNNEELSNSLTGADNNDNWQKGQTGFRYDFRDWDLNKLTLQGDFYNGQKGYPFDLPTGSFPFSSPNNQLTTFTGSNLMLKWNLDREKFNTDIKAYIDYAARDDSPVLKQEIITNDIDIQTQYNYGIHSFIGGAEIRYITDNLQDSQYVGYKSDETSASVLSTFLQDKIAVIPEKLFLTLGSKLTYSEYTNFEVQPSARVSYSINEDHTVWAAISQALRTPARGEDGFSGFTPTGNPSFVSIVGSESYQSEKLTAYELGYRGDVSNNLFFDVSAFYNDYDDLRTGQASVGAPPIIIATGNNGYGETYGIETYAVWGVTDKWDLKPSYTLLLQNFHLNSGSNDTILEHDEERSPENQFSLGSYYKVTKDVNWDSNLYYVSNLHYYANGGTGPRTKIDGYARLDSQVRWNVMKDVELSLIGQNLLDDKHLEFDETLYSQASEISRTVLARIKVKF
jgi:iron complex outermembrane receptor protein